MTSRAEWRDVAFRQAKDVEQRGEGGGGRGKVEEAPTPSHT